MFREEKKISGTADENRKGLGQREGLQWNTRKLLGDDIYVHYLDCL